MEILTIKSLSIVMVLIGSLFLFLSLRPTRKIRQGVAAGHHRQWRVILGLLVFFLAGYLFFILILVCNLRCRMELVTGGVFLGGALFVYLIINICQSTIAARKEAENGISLLNVLRLVVDNIPQQVFWKDADLRYLGCNRAFADFAGLENSGRIIGRKDLHMGWNDAAHCEETDRRVTEHNLPMLNSEEPLVLEDGEVMWLRISRVPLNDSGGSVVGMLGIFEDITERKKVKESLVRSEKNLAKAQAIAHLGSWEYYLEKDEEYRSAEFFRLLGYTEKESGIANDSVFDYIHPDDREMVWTKIAATLTGKKPYNVEYRIIGKDGIERHVHAKGKIIRDEDEKTTRFIGTIQDITKRKKTEEALWFTQYSVDQSPFPIFRLNRDGGFAYTNEACRYLGYTAEELKAMTIFDISPGITREKWAERLTEIEEKGTETFERMHRHKDGRVIPVELTVHQLNYNGMDFHVTYVRDISEQKAAGKRIKTQLERLNSLRAIDLAISGSIDLRVSLNVVLDQVTTQLNADAADILLLNYACKLEYAAGRGFRTDALKHTSLHLGNGNAGRVALERRTIHIPKVGDPDDPFRNAPLLHEEGFVGYYGSPLVAKGQVVGVLEVFYRSQHQLEQERLDFLEILAGQAAIAIDNATLFSGLQRSNVELVQAYDSTLEGWSRAMDLRDRETEGHCQRVTELTEHIARAIGIPDDQLLHIRRGAMLHDIGKMGIPDHILLKPGPLDPEERKVIEKHPIYAFELLSPITFLRPALDIPYCHHEKWDGTGYPRGLKGAQIPLAARIFAIIDVWDALLSDRPYRPAWSKEKTQGHIQTLSGTHFDPRVVEAFTKIIQEGPVEGKTRSLANHAPAAYITGG